MAKLPDVYYITINNGWGVIKNTDGTYETAFEEYSMIAEEDLQQEIDNIYNAFNSQPKVHKYDPEMLRIIGKNFMHGLTKIGEADELYPPKIINKLVDCLKDEKENLQRLSEALKPVSSSDINEEENNMAEKEKREEVAVRFYEKMVSGENINLKKGDATIKMKRVKMPNDDPKDSQVRRSFLVKESAIHTDVKNPHMKFTYLGKDQEYTVVRKNFDPETKKSEILEETKMTGEQIADVFNAERDRQYADWKANQPEPTNEIANPETELVEDAGMDM